MKIEGYEFTDIKTKNGFNKTAFAHKLNKELKISAVISIILFVLSIILVLTKLILPSIISVGITSISFIISCYLDGKRDGAIKQYKYDLK